ncbi:ketopantoate reductase family protein [Modestobacter sp. SSW1-42]|uniref:ketopantoate reductase family protein n=1 Tax=Modestobacter sp. SSW1-42 TaxID=596372 RepID=UPI003985FBA9
MSGDGWTVVGAGAVGGSLATGLALAGVPVRLVDTDAEHVAAVRAGGLRIRRPDGTELRADVPADQPTDGPRELGRVLLAVKAQATGAAMGWVAPRLAADGFVVSAQNGLCEQQVAAAVGADRTVACFVNLFADLVEPGVVADGGGGTVVVGEWTGPPRERTRRAVAELSARRPVQLSENVPGFLWSKLAYTAAAAAGSTTDEPIGAALGGSADVVLALVHEVYRVASAEGVRPEAFDEWDADGLLPDAGAARNSAALTRMCDWLVAQPKDRTGIWRDLVVRRRPTEVPALLAPVRAAARRHRLPCPGLDELLAVYARLESGDQRTGPTHLSRLAAAVAA